MARWSELERDEPEFAAAVRARFDVGKHKTIATLRADGSPRISGIEVEFDGDDLTFGSMTGSRKGADLVRDPRFALHSPSVDPPEDEPAAWPGEAKVAGRAVVTGSVPGEGDEGDTPPAGEAFRADIDEVVLTKLTDAGDRLLVLVWRPGHPLRRIERE